jgi:hypothetical protein
MARLRNELESRRTDQTRLGEAVDDLTESVISAAASFVDAGLLGLTRGAVRKLVTDSIRLEHVSTRRSVGTVYLNGRGKNVYSTAVRSARSVKVVNVLFRLNDLIVAAGQTAPSMYGAWQVKWLAPFAILVLITRVRSLTEIPLQPLHAITLLAMWGRADATKRVIGAGLLQAVNTELRRHDRSEITEEELQETLKCLENVKAIQSVLGSASDWMVKEEVATSGVV